VAIIWECHILKSNQTGSWESCTHSENGTLGFLEQSYHSSENMAPLVFIAATVRGSSVYGCFKITANVTESQISREKRRVARPGTTVSLSFAPLLVVGSCTEGNIQVHCS